MIGRGGSPGPALGCIRKIALFFDCCGARARGLSPVTGVGTLAALRSDLTVLDDCLLRASDAWPWTHCVVGQPYVRTCSQCLRVCGSLDRRHLPNAHLEDRSDSHYLFVGRLAAIVAIAVSLLTS